MVLFKNVKWQHSSCAKLSLKFQFDTDDYSIIGAMNMKFCKNTVCKHPYKLPGIVHWNQWDIININTGQVCFKLKLNEEENSIWKVTFSAVLLHLFRDQETDRSKTNATFPFRRASQMTFPFSTLLYLHGLVMNKQNIDKMPCQITSFLWCFGGFCPPNLTCSPSFEELPFSHAWGCRFKELKMGSQLKYGWETLDYRKRNAQFHTLAHFIPAKGVPEINWKGSSFILVTDSYICTCNNQLLMELW